MLRVGSATFLCFWWIVEFIVENASHHRSAAVSRTSLTPGFARWDHFLATYWRLLFHHESKNAKSSVSAHDAIGRPLRRWGLQA